MKSSLRKLITAVALTTAAGMFVACEDGDDDGAIENAGERIQDAADDAGDAVDDAMD
jgi:hypothetical protein